MTSHTLECHPHTRSQGGQGPVIIVADSADPHNQSSDKESMYIEANGGPAEHLLQQWTSRICKIMYNQLGVISCNNKRVCGTQKIATFPTHSSVTAEIGTHVNIAFFFSDQNDLRNTSVKLWHIGGKHPVQGNLTSVPCVRLLTPSRCLCVRRRCSSYWVNFDLTCIGTLQLAHFSCTKQVIRSKKQYSLKTYKNIYSALFSNRYNWIQRERCGLNTSTTESMPVCNFRSAKGIYTLLTIATAINNFMQ
jgi:hypothetical protein